MLIISLNTILKKTINQFTNKQTMIQFGNLPTDADCFTRPGSYAIIPEGEQIALVRIIGWGKYFLPGGGIDEGETPEDALRRESEEETGYSIEVWEKIGEAAVFVRSKSGNSYINLQGNFFSAKIIAQDLSLMVEEDHETVWITQKEALEVLHLDSHRWALQKWLSTQ